MNRGNDEKMMKVQDKVEERKAVETGEAAAERGCHGGRKRPAAERPTLNKKSEVRTTQETRAKRVVGPGGSETEIRRREI